MISNVAPSSEQYRRVSIPLVLWQFSILLPVVDVDKLILQMMCCPETERLIVLLSLTPH